MRQLSAKLVPLLKHPITSLRQLGIEHEANLLLIILERSWVWFLLGSWFLRLHFANCAINILLFITAMVFCAFKYCALLKLFCISEFSVEPITPVAGVCSKCYGCKSALPIGPKHFTVTAENSTAMAVQGSIENPEYWVIFEFQRVFW